MEILDSPLAILGFSAELMCAIAGSLMFLGIFPLSKAISAKHVLNRQAGKGLLFIFAAALGFNLVDIYSSDWNGLLTFLISVLCISIVFGGLRISMSAIKEMNRVVRQETDRMIS